MILEILTDAETTVSLFNSQGSNQSEFALSGSFTDPRPAARPSKDDIVNDLLQLNEQFSTSPKNTSGVALRNPGKSSNSRPSSLVLELDPLQEDDPTPSPSPRVQKNPQALFDLSSGTSTDDTAGGTSSTRLSEELRERSGSVDTLKNEDALSPTPMESGEELAKDASKTSELESSAGKNLMEIGIGSKSSGKANTKLNLLGLENALDDFKNDVEDDLSSSLLKVSTNEGGKLAIPRENSGSREDLLSSSYGSEDLNVNSLSLDSLGDLKMGQVICAGDKKTGTVRYIGPADFAPGVWIGVELDTPSGELFTNKVHRLRWDDLLV